MKRFLAVLLGAVIAAAFLGPGTITTAARAGASHGFALLWTLAFATVACLVLQEASARLTIVSGLNLGEALARRNASGLRRWLVLGLVAGAIIVGCAAYEAGNILGGVAGAELAFPGSRTFWTLLSVVAAGTMLWLGSTRVVVTVLSALVAVMGTAFMVTAVLVAPPLDELLGGFWPQWPENGGLLVLGLVGTTVVPYNLFLGSGLARGQKLNEMRFGLAVAILLGGLISMAVLVVGAAITTEFSFSAIAETLASRLGSWAEVFFAAGLFAAGFSSAITAPLAAAITARSVLHPAGGDEEIPTEWRDQGRNYRAVWIGVLLVGAFFGVTGIKPIPVIIFAQALNGVLLPVVAVFLLVTVNDRDLLGDERNGPLANAVLGVVVLLTILLGLRSLTGAWGSLTQLFS